LTAGNLSETFGLPLVLERHGERWSARAARAAPVVPDTPETPDRPAELTVDPLSSNSQ